MRVRWKILESRLHAKDPVPCQDQVLQGTNKWGRCPNSRSKSGGRALRRGPVAIRRFRPSLQKYIALDCYPALIHAQCCPSFMEDAPQVTACLANSVQSFLLRCLKPAGMPSSVSTASSRPFRRGMPASLALARCSEGRRSRSRFRERGSYRRRATCTLFPSAGNEIHVLFYRGTTT